MQPNEPLNPGETYLDEDLGVEVVAVESAGCSYPHRWYEPDAEKRLDCAYCGHCNHTRGCSTSGPGPDIVYLPKLRYAVFKLTQLVI